MKGKGSTFAFVRRLPKSSEHVLYSVNGTGLSEIITINEAACRGKDLVKQGGLLSGCKDLIEVLTQPSKAVYTPI